jgi:hypothetical protein
VHDRSIENGLRVLAPAALLIGSLVVAAPSGAAPLGLAPLIGPRAPAPPTPAEIASAYEARAATRSRKVKAMTTDRRPGGLLEVDITVGEGALQRQGLRLVPGPRGGRLLRHRVRVAGRRGRAVPQPGRQACLPAGTAVPAYYSYKKRWRVLVRVCLEKHNRPYYCSGWK